MDPNATGLMPDYYDRRLSDFAQMPETLRTKPSPVSRVIARQHEALTSRSRSRAAKATAKDLKDRGIKPGFMREAK
jgi:hypothetical protein